MKGVTAQYAPESEIRAASRSVERQALARILRTGRIKTANGAEQARERELIQAYQPNQRAGKNPGFGAPNTDTIVRSSELVHVRQASTEIADVPRGFKDPSPSTRGAWRVKKPTRDRARGGRLGCALE